MGNLGIGFVIFFKILHLAILEILLRFGIPTCTYCPALANTDADNIIMRAELNELKLLSSVV